MDRDKLLAKAQKNEITEYNIYKKLAQKTKDSHNKDILERIASDEIRHYTTIKSITNKEIGPNALKMRLYLFLASVFGLPFSLRLMEKGETIAMELYKGSNVPQLEDMFLDEQRHEKNLIGLLSEEKIQYAGSIVLGLNDAVVELTGVLGGLTFALQDTRIVAVIGCITGLAAALSMGASEYLSLKEENHGSNAKSPLRGSLYTGITYFIVVVLLILPYLFLSNVYRALLLSITITVTIIAFYTFYITTAKSVPFWKRFMEMVLISLGVAAVSFGIGLVMRNTLGFSV